MGLIFMDGFDHYETADLLKKWSSASWVPSQGGSPGVGPAWARSPGGQGLNINAAQNLSKVFATSYATGIIGVNFLTTNIANGATFLVLLDSNNNEQVSLRLDNTGHILVSRNGTTLATSANALSQNTWYHIEVKFTINNTTGAYEVRVNGTSTGWIPPAINQNTRAQTNNSFVGIRIWGNNNVSYMFDDLYVLSGTAPNGDFVGPQKILTLYPSGPGNYAQWAPNWMSNYRNVSEITGDADNTFNQSSTPAQIDSFPLVKVPSTATITAVQHNLLARQDAGAQRQLAAFQRGPTANDNPLTTFNLAGSYVYYTDPHDTDPGVAPAAAYTPANLNSEEIGYDLIA